MRTCIPAILASCWLALTQAAPSCQDLTITISTSANNILLPDPLNASISTLLPDLLSDLYNLPTHLVSGTYDIAAIFCEPENYNASRHNTLQVLSHGLTGTKEYWSGLGYNGTKYSYVDFASKEGYPTLAYDRICNSASSKPSAVLDCQIPLNTEILYAIIEQARAGVFGKRAFDNVIPVCHSEGSIACQFLLQTRPDAIETMVLTAFSNRLLIAGPGSQIAGGFLPAALVAPDRFGDNLDLFYLLATLERGIEGLFFFGDYDPALAHFDYENRHPLTFGELATAPLSTLPAPEYTGEVFVLNGAQDEIWCANLPTDPILGFRGDCGKGESSVTAQLRSTFPKADFDWAQTDQCGHDINLHRNNVESFGKIFGYLERKGY